MSENIEKEFRLIYYYNGEDTSLKGKMYRGKMVTRQDYVLIDPETLQRERISRGKLIKLYIADKSNSRPSQKTKIDFTNRLTRKSA